MTGFQEGNGFSLGWLARWVLAASQGMKEAFEFIAQRIEMEALADRRIVGKILPG